MEKHYDVYLNYKERIDEILVNSIDKVSPESLYLPLKYILSSGGKRIRPMMLIFSCEVFGGKVEEALNASAAIEMLHNFTLVHDDIMDNASTRRGSETVHEKWNNNTAILSGDHLIGLAYSYLLKTSSSRLNEIIKTFTEGIIEVCEGQSYDKEFEVKKHVTLEEYMMMISKKTAKMLETSSVIGALISGADISQVEMVRDYAANIGQAFQIQDDLLDINAEEHELGKPIGGDLVEGKKTYLLLKAMEVINDNNDRSKIEEIITNDGFSSKEVSKILEVKQIYKKHGIIDSALNEIAHYKNTANKCLDSLPEGEHKERLKWFSNMLMSRSF
jgi:geranylgeranyl diphosphate synthase type II